MQEAIVADHRAGGVDLQDPAWYLAATLAERSRSGGPGRARGPATDAPRAGRRLRRWREELGLDDTAWLERLAADGLREDDLCRLLGEPADAVRARLGAPPAWLRRLGRAFDSTAPSAANPPATEWAGLLNAVWPLVRDGQARLRSGIEARCRGGAVAVGDGAHASMLDDLALLLWQCVARTMALELNVARLQGALRGATPQERFQSFVERLRDPAEALRVLRRYPVLARLVAECVERWEAANLALVGHLCEDWPDLRRAFPGAAEPGALEHVQSGLGDSHRGGRSVCLLRFESGFRVVYKPRSLAVDLHFQELLGWLNARGQHPRIRTLALLDRGDHGWVELVRAAGCATPQEVTRFYERQGGYLALLHLLHAADFHFENLIAAGEHPVPVDLEALFHVDPVVLPGAGRMPPGALAIRDSVLGTGLLPQWSFIAADGDGGVEMSGLGGTPGQLTSFPVPEWEGVGTDEMRLVRRPMEIGAGRNRPSLDGAPVTALDHVDDVVRGFTGTYRLLARHREELLAEPGPLTSFLGDEVRCILRPTRTYGLMLLESFHPDLLGDGLARDRFLDRLWAGWTGDPMLARIVRHEREDLRRGDIPAFFTRPGSRDLWSASGERIGRCFDLPAMAAVRRRARRLGEADLARQTWYVRASFTALTMGDGQARWPTCRIAERSRPATEAALLAAARRIGDRLELLALDGDGHAGHAGEVDWVGLTLLGRRRWVLSALGSDLYGGSSGIALFLGYLGEVTGDARYRRLAERAIAAVRRQTAALKDHPRTAGLAAGLRAGGFSQTGGIVYALTHLGALWGAEELLDQASLLAELVEPTIADDREYDVIGGAAGYLCTLLGLAARRPRERTIGMAVRCGDHLLAHALEVGDGIAWRSTISGSRPLTGFSHGASGIAHALIRLAAASGQQRFADAALAAMAYERGLYSPAHRNWPDLRELDHGTGATTEGDAFMTAWCHGAPGIGLARANALRYLDDARVRADLALAVAATLDSGLDLNHSLCHGVLGNLETLLQAAAVSRDGALRERVYRIAAGLLDSIDAEGWRCGVPEGAETPGLLNGLSGIGYGLLRLAAPERVPSVLDLSPPPEPQPAPALAGGPRPAGAAGRHRRKGGDAQETPAKETPAGA